MAQTVVGIFEDSIAAQNAKQRLIAYGFTESDIDITDQGNGNNGSSYTDSTDHSGDGFGDRISRFFKNLFDDDDDVERYSNLARNGTVVSAYADSREEAERAADILDEFGAINVDEHSTGFEKQSTDVTGSATGIPGSDTRNVNNDQSIPVIEEDLQIGKREVERGGMRVRSRIIERPVEESLRLREEHVSVDRQSVNRPASESDLSTFREGEIEVRERAEVPVINKQARVVEEVNVRKDVRERDEVIRDTVRKTEVEVEKMDETDNLPETDKKSKNRI